MSHCRELVQTPEEMAEAERAAWRARLAELERPNALMRQKLGMAAEEKDANNVSAGGVGENADRVKDDKDGGLTTEEMEAANKAEAELSEMTDGKADGKADGMESALGAGDSADHHNMTGVGAKDDKVGGLTTEEMDQEEDPFKLNIGVCHDEHKEADKESANGVSAGKNALGVGVMDEEEEDEEEDEDDPDEDDSDEDDSD